MTTGVARDVDRASRPSTSPLPWALLALVVFMATTWLLSDTRWLPFIGHSRLVDFIVCASVRVLWVPPAAVALVRWTEARHQAGPSSALHEAVWQEGARRRNDRVRRVQRVLQGADSLEMHFQPVVALSDGHVVGVEALSRFTVETEVPPDVWFAEAHELGMGVELELHALRKGLAAMDRLDPTWFVALNLSPTTMIAPALHDLLACQAAGRLVLELTEHEQVADYDELARTLAPLRARGVRLSVDDAGAGFASMRHILKVRPEFVKLDRTLVCGLHDDIAKRALATSLVAFADKVGATVVAEGMETAEEVVAVRDLGVHCAQGYYFARPSPWPTQAVYPLPARPAEH